MAILDQYGNPAMMSGSSRRPMRSANLGGGERPSESQNLRDLHKILTKHDRRTLVSASKTLYFNSPLMVGALNQIGIYSVGNAWLPVYKGNDVEFGLEAKQWLTDEWYPICNANGDTCDFTSDMFVDSVSADRDGEVFEYITATDAGYPQIQMIPAHRIDNGGLPDGRIAKGRYSGSQFTLEDGIVYWSGTSRAVAYAFTDELGQHKEFIDKQFICHTFDRHWPEQKRGLPIFWHSLNNLRDILQSEEWERFNLLNMSRLLYTIENESGGPDPEDPSFDPATCGTDPSISYVNNGQIMFARAGAGEKIQQHPNLRPGNPWHEFYDMQARSCLTGINWPASLWKPSGQGTSERADIGKAVRFVEDRQTLLHKIAKWRITKALAYGMANGRIRKSADWWNWNFTKPAKLTIDDGRTAKENLEMFRAGIINKTAMIGERGSSFEESLAERGHEIAKTEMNRLEMEKQYGIKIDPRYYTMLTPNEMAPTETALP